MAGTSDERPLEIEDHRRDGTEMGCVGSRLIRVATISDDCCTCSSHPREIRCLPCKHQATCELCAARHFLEEMRRGHRPPWCPWCRAPVSSVDRAEPEKDGAADPSAPDSAPRASDAPRTRRICTFRPDPPNDTEESVEAFYSRVKGRLSTRELRRRRRESIASAFYEWLGVYCATMVAVLLFLGAVYAMSKLFFVFSELEGPAGRQHNFS
jgi:hypothetical protein